MLDETLIYFTRGHKAIAGAAEPDLRRKRKLFTIIMVVAIPKMAANLAVNKRICFMWGIVDYCSNFLRNIKLSYYCQGNPSLTTFY